MKRCLSSRVRLFFFSVSMQDRARVGMSQVSVFMKVEVVGKDMVENGAWMCGGKEGDRLGV